jgi:hypothetical protein
MTNQSGMQSQQSGTREHQPILFALLRCFLRSCDWELKRTTRKELNETEITPSQTGHELQENKGKSQAGSGNSFPIFPLRSAGVPSEQNKPHCS